MPMERHRYPSDWGERALAVKTAAGWKCQLCRKQCRRPGEKYDTQARTLTVAHLDDDPENPNARLAALCAPCHLRYDAKAKGARKAEKNRRLMTARLWAETALEMLRELTGFFARSETLTIGDFIKTAAEELEAREKRAHAETRRRETSADQEVQSHVA